MGNTMIGNYLEPPVDDRWLDKPTQADLRIPWRLHGNLVVRSLDQGISVNDVLVSLLPGDHRALSLNSEDVRALAEKPEKDSTQDPPVDETIEWPVGLEFQLTKAAREAGVDLNDLVVGLLWKAIHPETETETLKPDPRSQPNKPAAEAIA